MEKILTLMLSHLSFFFLISLLVKMMNGITFLLNGGKVNGANFSQNPFNYNRRDNQQQDNDDDFVDYEEVD